MKSDKKLIQELTDLNACLRHNIDWLGSLDGARNPEGSQVHASCVHADALSMARVALELAVRYEQRLKPAKTAIPYKPRRSPAGMTTKKSKGGCA